MPEQMCGWASPASSGERESLRSARPQDLLPIPCPSPPVLKGTPRYAFAGPGWGLGCPGAVQGSQWAGVIHTHTCPF